MKTKAGRIPENWVYTKLNELVVKHNAGVYKKKALFGEGYNIVGVSNLYNINSVDGQTFKRVPLSDDERSACLSKEILTTSLEVNVA